MFNKRKGFTLVEIIVAMALLGLLSVVFVPSLSSHFLWLVNTKTNVTQEAFAEQYIMEERIKNVQNALASGNIETDDYDSFGISSKVPIELFKGTFSSTSYPLRQYPNAYQIDGGKGYITLVGDKRLPELPVPKIIGQSLVFLQDGTNSLNKYEYYNYPTLKLKATSNMTENPSNSFNRYRNDWYVSKPGFNIPVQDDYHIDEDLDFGRIYPDFPDDYDAVPIYSDLGSSYSYVSPTNRIINVELANSYVSQYPGRHIMYTITPFAKSLKQGTTTEILPKYIYGPSFTDSLALHFDASVIDMSDTYHSTANSTGTLVIQDGNHNIRNWKNSRPSAKNQQLNQSATQTNVNNMPILLKNDDPSDLYTGHAIPFQEGEMGTRVWSRALGNKSTTMSTMRISNINFGADLNVFIVLRKVDSPVAPRLNESIIRGNANGGSKLWSLEWIGEVGSPRLSFITSSNNAELTSTLNLDEWYLIRATAQSTNLSLVANSLKRDSNHSLSATGTKSLSSNTRTIDINWNGVDIAEILVYNNNISASDLGSIESYLVNKYNPVTE